MANIDEMCHCGSGNSFDSCCLPYLSGEALPPTAEALMRSRYSAFVTLRLDYILETHTTSDRLPESRAALERSLQDTEWINLTVLDTKQGRASDGSGEVTFVAAFKPRGMSAAFGTAPRLGQLHERSRFVRQDDRWLYTGGDQLLPYQPSRNDLCWCGSGMKYKKCCG
ncbi:MAG: YchJ family metal-binding protein [Pseudomonadota bacterium]